MVHLVSILNVKAFVDGITACVIGAIVGSVVIISTRSIIDIPTAISAIVTVFALIYVKKLQEPHVIFVAAILGLIIKFFKYLLL